MLRDAAHAIVVPCPVGRRSICPSRRGMRGLIAEEVDVRWSKHRAFITIAAD